MFTGDTLFYKNLEPSESLSKTRKSQIPNSTDDIIHHIHVSLYIEMTPFRLIT